MISGGVEVNLIHLNLFIIRSKIWRRSLTRIMNIMIEKNRSAKFIDWFNSHSNICLYMTGRKIPNCLRFSAKGDKNALFFRNSAALSEFFSSFRHLHDFFYRRWKRFAFSKYHCIAIQTSLEFSLLHMRRFAQMVSPFVQFQKREKQPWRSVAFRLQYATLLKVTLLHGCFSRF